MKLSTLGLSARQTCVLILAALAIAVPAVCAQGLSSGRYIPHIAQGQGWTTELHVFNVCSSPGVYRIFFYGSDGHRKAFLLEGAADLQREPDRVDHIAGSDGQEIDREVHVWRFVDTGQELLQGYGRIFDDNGGRTSDITDGGCVVTDIFYKQHLPNGQVLSTAIPLQRLSGLGSVLAFNSTGGCSTGVAIAGNGGTVQLEAVGPSGQTIGQADLGNIHHTAFPLGEPLPVQGTRGTVRINGEVSVLGLEFCQGKLVQFRLPQPVPPVNPWIVVSFESKFLRYYGGNRIGVYGVKLTLRNPTQTARTYAVDVAFKDADGFLLENTQAVFGWTILAGKESEYAGNITASFDGADDVNNVAKVEVSRVRSEVEF